MQFARKYAAHDWSSTLFTDEKYFPMVAPLNRKNDVVWAEPGDTNLVRRKKAAGVQVWAGISERAKTDLVFLEGPKNSASYISQCLEPELKKIKSAYGRRPFCLQQDGARKHTSAETVDWLRRKKMWFIPPEDWPANSPDLNPIENLWSWMEVEVWKLKPTSVEDMKRKLRSVWERVDEKMRKKFISVMRGRVEKVIELGGECVT